MENDDVLDSPRIDLWLTDLDGWTPEGVATKIDLARFLSSAIDSSLPPWRPIPSRSAARLLGTNLQSLANWRMRHMGPTPEPVTRGRGNRIYYRPDSIAKWLSGGRYADWRLSCRWLQAKGMIPSDVIERNLVLQRIDLLESLDLFPPVHQLWRSFRAWQS